MRAQVVDGAAALADFRRALPVGRLVGLVPVKVRLELDDAAQRALLDQLGGRSVVGVPPAVLVHAQHALLLAGQGDQLVRLGRGRHKGLLAEDVLAGLQGLAGEVKVCGRGGGEDDQVEVGVSNEAVICGVVLQVRVVGGSGVVRLG